jgi:uncharacterized membrane protein
MKNTFKQDEGTAGLTILLSVIVMLFIIGLLIMIFSLMGASLQTSLYDKLTAGSVANESILIPTTGGITLAKALYTDGACGAITAMLNHTAGNVIIPATNYTQVGCVVYNASSLAWLGATVTNVRVSYPYTYSASNTATQVMNDTTHGLSETTNWFSIFIVITAMIVLILLTVIIITAIRSSGMIGGGTVQGAGKIGTA